MQLSRNVNYVRMGCFTHWLRRIVWLVRMGSTMIGLWGNVWPAQLDTFTKLRTISVNPVNRVSSITQKLESVQLAVKALSMIN